MSISKKGSDGFDEEELIRAEFDSIISGLSLDQSSPSTYLDDLDRMDQEGFVHPTPPPQSARSFIHSIKTSFLNWFHRGNRDDDGATL